MKEGKAVWVLGGRCGEKSLKFEILVGLTVTLE